MSIHHDRLAWVQAFQRSGDAGEVCARFAISRATLRKWRLRYESGGVAGLENASRAPRRSPARKVFEAEAARIGALRRAGLPLARIRAVLLDEGLDVSVPTIRRVLGRQEVPLVAPERQAPGLFSAILPDDLVFRGLAGQITQGQVRPGERLTEERLCQAFKVGRTRVREALRSLAMIGLVTLGPRRGGRNRGAIVARPSGQAILDAYAARRLVEAGVVRDLARQRDEVHVAALREHLRRQSDAERRGDKVTLVRLLTEFHLLLAGLTGNPFLRGFVETLATTTSLGVLLYDQSTAPSCAVAEHRQLVRMIEEGDGDGAARLMAEHLGHNQDRLEQLPAVLEDGVVAAVGEVDG